MTATDARSPTTQDTPPTFDNEGTTMVQHEPPSQLTPTPPETTQPDVPHSERPKPSLSAPSPEAGDNPSIATGIPMDPKVVALLAMFPDFDTSVLQSVLESVGGDQDRAVDVLLGMSDPSYTSNERVDATQTELDEEIARRLMLEESQQQASWRPRAESNSIPYRARGGPSAPPGGPQQRPTESDGVAQFQEQLGKIAETGKKTFNTLLSKVKAKMQEFDNPSAQAQASGSGRPLPGGDSWSTPAQSQSYYDPNPLASVRGYDLGAPVHPHTPGHSLTSATNQSATVSQPMVSSNTDVPSSPTRVYEAPTTGNVDPSKIGLLPKHPVSLGSSPQPTRNIADDDEVEYVENPFEESARR